MFVCSIKTNRRQLLTLCSCIVLLLAVIFTANGLSGKTAPVAAPIDGATEEAQVRFLRSIGYEAETPSVDIREVQLPMPFDEAFTAYNEMQKQASMDMSPYQGARVRYVTYRLKDDERDMAAHLYIYNGSIIGGDIASADGGVRILTGLRRAGSDVT